MRRPVYENPSGVLYQGNCLDVLAEMEPDSIQCCITSPPYYGLRSYLVEPTVWGGDPSCSHEWGDTLLSSANDSNRHTMNWTTGGNPAKKTLGVQTSQGQFCKLCGAWSGNLGNEPTPKLYIEHLVQIFGAVHRVLRKDGTLWINIADSYNGSGKAGRNPDYQDKHTEFGKPSVHKERFGIPTKIDGLKPKDLIGIPWMLAFALRDFGWYLRSEIIWQKVNPLPESVTDRPTKAHEQIFLLTKNQHYFYDAEAVMEDSLWDGKSGNKNYRVWSEQGREEVGMNSGGARGGRNKRSVWTFQTAQIDEPHFATFPETLVETPLLAGTSEKGCCVACGAPLRRIIQKVNISKQPPGGKLAVLVAAGSRNDGNVRMGNTESTTIGWEPCCNCGKDTIPCNVLDPFFGSGTVGVVAKRHGRRWVGIELSDEYCQIAIRRQESAKFAIRGMRKQVVRSLCGKSQLVQGGLAGLV